MAIDLVTPFLQSVSFRVTSVVVVTSGKRRIATFFDNWNTRSALCAALFEAVDLISAERMTYRFIAHGRIL